MSSADTETGTPDGDAPAEETPAAREEVEEVEVDEIREALLAEVSEIIGDAIVESHIKPGRSLTIRIASESWIDVHRSMRDTLGFKFFEFLSAIDWLPSPFGKSEDSAVDRDALVVQLDNPGEPEQGYAGGDTRFQVFTRLVDITRENSPGIVIKTDVEDPRTTPGAALPTLVSIFPGANWPEREIHEMYGLVFDGHPYLEPLYLPSDFEGNPLRKDFPLLARHVKPWPGIVDVEPMPDVGGDDETTEDAEK